MIFLIFFGIVMGLNLIPELVKKEYPKTEKVIAKIVLYATLLFFMLILLSFVGIRLRGLYTRSIIGFTFLIACIIYFATNKNTKNKIKTIVILYPLFFVGFYFHFFYKNLGTYKVNNELNINVSQEGFLCCGEIMRLTKTRLLIFEEEIVYCGSQCLIGIDRVETIEFNNQHAEFLIYHNRSNNSENPYHYEIENKNYW